MDNATESEKAPETGRGGLRDATAAWYLRIPPEVFSFALFLAVTLFLTWPVIARLATTTYGYPSDNQGVIWRFWWLRNAADFGAAPSFCPLVGFPFGSPLNFFPFEVIADFFERFMLLFTGEVVVYNVEVVSSFFLSGVAMYFLVRYLTKDNRAALFGGFAYTVFVYHAYHAMIFNHLAMTQWIPLFILALIYYMRKPGLRSAAYLILAGLLVAGTDAHYGLFMTAFTAAFLVGHYAYNRADMAASRKRLAPVVGRPFNLKTLALSLIVVVVVASLTLPFYYGHIQRDDPETRWPTRPTRGSLRGLEVDKAGSARPEDYVLPSTENYFLGWITAELVGTGLNPFENSLYIGWTVILLAAFGVAVALRRRHPAALRAPPEDPDPAGLGASAGENPRKWRPLLAPAGTAADRAVIWGLLAAAALAFVLSMPPYVEVGSFRIPLPSMVVSYAVPWLRWFMRFGVVVITCAIVLACFGLSWVLSRVRRIPVVVILVVVLALLMLEMTLVPPLRYFETNDIPEVYGAIAEFPPEEGFVIYPAYEPGFFNSQRYVFYQREFQRPMLNGAPEGTDGEALRRTVYNPYNPDTPAILSRFDITRMVYLGELFKSYEGTLEQEREVELLPDGFEFEEAFTDPDNEFGDARVYTVTAPPAELVPIYMGDITTPHIETGRATVRLMETDAILMLANYTGETVDASVLIPVANIQHEHRVVVYAEGAVIWEGTLRGEDRGGIEIESVRVPPEGIALDIAVEGELAEVSGSEGHIFGTRRASLRIGDAKIEVRR